MTTTVSSATSAATRTLQNYVPFSGWKDSFLGDLHADGGDAVDFYPRKKTITSRFFSEESGKFFTEQ